MSDADDSKSPAVASYYDRAAEAVPAFTVLNYGFSSEPETSRVPTDHPEFYCLRLYEHAVRNVPLTDKDVIEISCGRGGGADFLMRTFAIRSYLGIDLSAENVRLANERQNGPTFVVGRAERLDAQDGSMDVAINIEASHLYDDRRVFFSEVARVLKPGGFFCYTDGCWADDDCSADLLAAGFSIDERQDVTDNVVRALELDSKRRAELFDAMADDSLVNEYKDWGGVIGYRAHRRFVERRTLYFSHILRKI